MKQELMFIAMLIMVIVLILVTVNIYPTKTSVNDCRMRNPYAFGYDEVVSPPTWRFCGKD